MRTRFLQSLLAACLCATPAFASTPGYNYSGAGFQLGFIISDDTRFADIAADFGGQADIAFGLGPVGELHYCPRFGIWLTGDDSPSGYNNFYMELHFDAFDLRYYPPIPDHVKVRPYGGMSPMFCVDIRHYEWADDSPPFSTLDDTDTHVNPGFNIYGGADFLVSSNFWLFAEMRGKLDSWDIFELTAGMTFLIGGTR